MVSSHSRRWAGLMALRLCPTWLPPSDVTNGGRTYFFELSPRIRYSNGELVAPSTSATPWNEVSASRMPTTGTFMGISSAGWWAEKPVGEPRTCDLSQGIVTDDTTITFNLAEPDPGLRPQAHDAVRVPGSGFDPRRGAAGGGRPGHGSLHAGGADDRRGTVRAGS